LVSPSKLAIDCLSVYAAKMLMPGAVISGCTKKFIQHGHWHIDTNNNLRISNY
jgi:hypothetical protein